MPRQIYRLEIINEVGRRGGNVRYEARDTLDGSSTELFEWNPAQVHGRTAADIEVAKTDVGDGEIFSDRSSYYLAIKPEHAKSTLTLLRARGLFTGGWASLFEDPPPPPPPPLPKPNAVKPPQIVRRGHGGGWIFFTFAFGLIAAVLALQLMAGRTESESGSAKISDLNQKINRMESETERINNDLTAANANLQKAQQATADLQTTATKEIDSLFQEAENRQAKLGSNYLPITVKNCSTQEVLVAVRYKSPLDIWVTRGWWKLKAQDLDGFTLQAEDASFDVYVKREGTPWPLDGQKESVEIADTLFNHEDGKTFFGGDRETVEMTRAEGLLALGCSN